jgi:hypothetical protein
VELEPGPLLVALDPGELDVRGVVRLDGLLEVDVQAVDLGEDLARLGLLRADRGVGGSRTYRGREGRKGDDERWRQPSM